MGTLSMTPGPFEYGAGMAVRLQVFRRVQLELPAAGNFLCLLVGTKVWEVGFDKELVILPGPFDACLLGLAGISKAEVRRQDELLALFPLLPFFLGDSVLSHC